MSKAYLDVGDTCTITQLGVDAREEEATVIEYVGNSQYVVETANKSRHLRYLDATGNQTGVDKIKSLLMRATDVELHDCQVFIENRLLMRH